MSRAEDADRMLDQIEDYIVYLVEELDEIKRQLDREKRWMRRQMLKDKYFHYELQLKLARREEKHLTEKMWGVKY